MRENGRGNFLFELTTCSFVFFNTASGYVTPDNFIAQQSNASMRKCALICFRLMLLRDKSTHMLVSINNIAHLNACDRFLLLGPIFPAVA